MTDQTNNGAGQPNGDTGSRASMLSGGSHGGSGGRMLAGGALVLATGVAAWFLFLIAITETNDIGQAWVGRRFGSHKIAPVLSPNKTWEGFFGGQFVAGLLAIAIGPYLTPLDWQQFVIAAVLIAVAGFFGDLNMSAVKRAAHVKDSGDALPGQGGILDRVDSLTFTAPLFYLYLMLILQRWPM